MSKKIWLAVLMVTLVAVPAFATVQNVKVSGDIDSTWVVRNNFDLGLNQTTNSNGLKGVAPEVLGDRNQNIFITQTRLKVDAELTENVATTIQLINERPWDDNDGGDATDVDLCQAFVELREMLYQPLTVKVGRQHLQYGNSFIIGPGGPNNIATNTLTGVADDLTKRTALDAVKVVLDYNPLTIDGFMAKVDADTVTAVVDTDDDVDLYGVNANYQLGDDRNTAVEAYFFTKTDKRTSTGGTLGTKTDTVYVPGLRASTNPIEGLNVQAEVAWQRGNKATTSTSGADRADNIQREAMGVQLITNYVVPLAATKKWNPSVMGVYTYVSGDHNTPIAADRGGWASSSEKYTAWDPMFEDQAGGTIYNTLFDLTNVHIAMASAQVNPIEDVTTKVTWTGMWLDRKVNTDKYGTSGAGVFNMRQPNATSPITPVVTSDRGVGYEIDADVSYAYTEDVSLSVSGGWFVPGDFFDSRNEEIATQFLTSVDVAF